MHTQRTLSVLKSFVYVLSALVLVLGLLVGISLLGSSGGVHNALLPLQVLAGGAIANLIAPYLIGLLSGLGVVVLVIALVLSLLLFALGRLLDHNLRLETRLARLEAAVAGATGGERFLLAAVP